ncbi:MAG: DsbC family protein [Gammaproteobacteria bacterium]|nr:DsbC family protein [Gammaproteobacteria bacterium]MDE2249853.1 DsbC family protein [Gammaproteobacteria bacterium]
MKPTNSLRWGLATVLCGAALALRAASAPAPSSPPPAAVPPTTVPAATTQLGAELAAVAAHIPGAHAGDLRTTPIPGIYEYRQGAELVYVTADGRYGFAGDLYRLADRNNLSDARRRELRLELLRAVPESSMVVFAPAQTKYTITVFTDVDCAYCRALHKQIADYNRLGVKVRYLFFPRTGPNTESWSKAEQVWCSADRQAALTQAKLGVALKTAVCKPNPVADDYALGRAIGLTGTPGIVTESGELLPGYAPPDELVQELQRDKLQDKPPG